MYVIIYMCSKIDLCEKCNNICDDFSYRCYLCINCYCFNCTKYKDEHYQICDMCIKQLNESEWITPNKELVSQNNPSNSANIKQNEQL